MTRFLISFLFAVCICGASANASISNVKEFGAKGDGVTLDTAAVQSAIDHAAMKGGTVEFDPGTYLIGSIFVKHGVTLKIGTGVTLLGSQRLSDYPVMPTRIAGIEMSWPAALVNVYGQSRVSIQGQGTIDGNGKIFWKSYWNVRKAYEARGLRWAADYDAQRPRLIQIFSSHGVRLGGGLHLRRSGFWTVHICYSDHVTVDALIIRNNEDGRGPSTDGVDIDSSSHVLVQHADIAVNDDALCLKAGRDSDGLRVNRPTEDVVIRDSIVRDGAAVITIGSETSGGFRNINAYRLTGLSHVGVGILFKSAHTRGGWAKDVRIHDITLTQVPVVLRITMNWNPSYSYARIPVGTSGYPAYWDVLARPVSEAQGRAHFERVRIWNIHATGAKTAFEVSAFPEMPLDHFAFKNLDIQAAKAGYIDDAKDWTFRNVQLDTADNGIVSLSDDLRIRGIASREADTAAPLDSSVRETTHSSGTRKE